MFRGSLVFFSWGLWDYIFKCFSSDRCKKELVFYRRGCWDGMGCGCFWVGESFWGGGLGWVICGISGVGFFFCFKGKFNRFGGGYRYFRGIYLVTERGSLDF